MVTAGDVEFVASRHHDLCHAGHLHRYVDCDRHPGPPGKQDSDADDRGAIAQRGVTIVAVDYSRIEELRRRVDDDPASPAFAQLAEEYRRAGALQEAVRVCRAGLAHHPSYTSARVTLGRALFDLRQDDEAQAQFEIVLLSAPENLIALRSMADIHQRRDDGTETVTDARDPVAGDPALSELESWLTAILDDRASRAAS